VALTIVLGLGLAAAYAGTLLRPVLEAQAAQVLKRPVSIERLRIRPGRITTLIAEGVTIHNPPGFPEEAAPWLAQVSRVVVAVEPLTWLRTGMMVVPRIEIDRPMVQARGLADGTANYLFEAVPGDATGSGGIDGPSTSQEPTGPRIGTVIVRDGRAQVTIARLNAEFAVEAATEEAVGEEPRVLAQARGMYAGRSIEASLIGGAVLSLRDTERPWPIRLDLANGPVRVRLEGTLRDPLGFRGADVRLTAEGPDMTLLQPWTGIPFPGTPPFRLAGKLDYVQGRVRLLDLDGRMGRTDLAGGVIVTLGTERPVVAAEIRSRRVDLRDWAGFIGAAPGRPGDPGQLPQQRRDLARAAADARALPDDPLSIPKLTAADVHVDYTAERIEGRSIPFDAITTQIDIVNGVVDVRRIVFRIGGGQLEGRVRLEPRSEETLHAQGEFELRRADFARLVGAAGIQGSGTIGGVGRLTGVGRSLSEIMARGEGLVSFAMVGGTVSAFMVDLAGMRFATALLSALGIPERERIGCLLGEFALRGGALSARTLLLDTESSVITGEGDVRLPQERLRLQLRSEPKRFTIGALPTPILLGGTLQNPRIGVEPSEMAARAGIAGGLAAALPPLALLPTIQLGVGENSQCEALEARDRPDRGRRSR
jgi:hypothetical protein